MAKQTTGEKSAQLVIKEKRLNMLQTRIKENCALVMESINSIDNLATLRSIDQQLAYAVDQSFGVADDGY